MTVTSSKTVREKRSGERTLSRKWYMFTNRSFVASLDREWESEEIRWSAANDGSC
jgi:hypothetical protein